MPLRPPSFPRLAAPFVIALVGPVDAIRAQELVSREDEIVDARFSEKVVDLPSDEPLAPGRDQLPDLKDNEGFDVSLAVSVAYDDNIFLSADNPRADLVTRVAPTVAYSVGQRDEDSGAHLRVAYAPGAVVYLDHNDESRIDQDLVIEAAVRGKQTALRYAGAFRRLGDATADTGSQSDRYEFGNELRFAWAVREKIAVEVGAGQRTTDYDDASLSDSQRQFGEVALKYAYSPKTQVAFIYRAGRFEVDRAGDQDFQQAVGKIAWLPRQKISVELEAGFEHRDYALGSDVFPIFDGRVGWQVKEGTEVYVSGYRREEASAFFSGQNYRLTGVAAGISQRLGEDWTLRLEVGHETADYRQVSGTGVAGREDVIYFIRPSADYAMNERLRLGAFYQYAKDDSNQPGFGYENHQVGVRMDYDF